MNQGSGLSNKQFTGVVLLLCALAAIVLQLSYQSIGKFAVALAIFPLIMIVTMVGLRWQAARSKRTDSASQLSVHTCAGGGKDFTVALAPKQRKAMIISSSLLTFAVLISSLTRVNTVGIMLFVLQLIVLAALLVAAVKVFDLLSRRAHLSETHLHTYYLYHGHQNIPLSAIQSVTTRHSVSSRLLGDAHGDTIEITVAGNSSTDQHRSDLQQPLVYTVKLERSMPNLSLLISVLKQRAVDNQQRASIK